MNSNRRKKEKKGYKTASRIAREEARNPGSTKNAGTPSTPGAYAESPSSSKSTRTIDSVLERKNEMGSRGSSKKSIQKGEDDDDAAVPEPPQLAAVPGSFAVQGPRGGGFDEVSDEESITSLEEGNPHFMEMGMAQDKPSVLAELVDPTEREEELRRVRTEALQEIQKGASVAEVVDEAAERKRRRRTYGVLFCITVASIVAVIAVVVFFATREDDPPIILIPTLAPTTKNDAVEAAVETLFGDGVLDDEGSPQYEAANWMTVNDTTLSFPIETEQERSKFRQRFAMCVLSFATNLDGWFNNARWLDPIDECEWSGLTCDANGRLVGISLVDVNLTGTLPTELGILSDLRYLFVNENPGLRGTLSDFLANMTSLVSFLGHNNGFEGPIPTEFGKLRSLENLNLSGNQLFGVLPVSLSRMIKLVELDLSSNQLGGSIPFQLWRLQELETLLLHDNRLQGTIPTDLGAMAMLRRAEVQKNFLEGPIPTHTGNLFRLQTFRVYENLLTGSVPESLCELREEPPFVGLNVLEADCISELNCTCCSQCY